MITEEWIVRWARYYAALNERFPLDTYKEQPVRRRRLAKPERTGVWYEQTRARKGLDVKHYGNRAAGQ